MDRRESDQPDSIQSNLLAQSLYQGSIQPLESRHPIDVWTIRGNNEAIGLTVRGEDVFIPKGDFVLEQGDRAVIIVTRQAEDEAIRVLKKGG